MRRIADKLCILGSAPTKADAPFDDKDYEIWAVSGAAFSESLHGERVQDTEDNSWNCVRRVDAFFEMHKRPTFAEKLDRLATCARPVIMQRRERDIPTAEAYPADEIAEELGEDFSSTIAYMLAYGIYLDYSEIRLYGVVMAHNTEYGRQRSGVKYYLGVAAGRNIKTWAPDNTQLTRPTWRYGYDDNDAICNIITKRRESLEADLKIQEQKITDARAAYHQLRGAAIDCDEIIAEIKGGIA